MDRHKAGSGRDEESNLGSKEKVERSKQQEGNHQKENKKKNNGGRERKQEVHNKQNGEKEKEDKEKPQHKEQDKPRQEKRDGEQKKIDKEKDNLTDNRTKNEICQAKDSGKLHMIEKDRTEIEKDSITKNNREGEKQAEKSEETHNAQKLKEKHLAKDVRAQGKENRKAEGNEAKVGKGTEGSKLKNKRKQKTTLIYN